MEASGAHFYNEINQRILDDIFKTVQYLLMEAPGTH